MRSLRFRGFCELAFSPASKLRSELMMTAPNLFQQAAISAAAGCLLPERLFFAASMRLQSVARSRSH
jgi:hypothetical protein